jgi:hypothetical protein
MKNVDIIVKQSVDIIVKQLDANKKFHKEVQKELREFVLNKKNPLEERFRVWKEYCKKIDAPWIIHKGEYGIIGEMVDACYPCEYDRYREYDYEDFLSWIADANEDEYESELWKETMKNTELPSVNQFKEMLIVTNFGSFNMDW